MTLELHDSALHHFPERGSGGIALFGATGKTGQAITSLALEAGIPIRALIRPGSGPVLGGADFQIGSPMDHEAVGRVIEGVDSVCCVLGPRPPYRDLFTAAATSVILGEMRERGVNRIVCLTGALVGRYPANLSLSFRLAGGLYRKANSPAALDRDRQEQMVLESDLDWTIAKPPRLTMRAARGKYKAGPRVRVGLMSRIGRADVAAFMVDAAVNGRASGEAVFLKY